MNRHSKAIYSKTDHTATDRTATYRTSTDRIAMDRTASRTYSAGDAKVNYNRFRLPGMTCAIATSLLILAAHVFLSAPSVQAQHSEPLYESRNEHRNISPVGAMLRSFVLPGWGQMSLGGEFKGRGRVHLGAEAVLVTSYTWLHFNSRSLENNMYTHVRRYAGVDIRDRSRSFQLAVAAHNSLAAYNEFQERSRQWNQLLDVTPMNSWEWQSEASRIDYQELRNRRDRNRQQLPAIATLMVANRIISGVHAFMSARRAGTALPEVSLALPQYGGVQGYSGLQATVLFRF